MTSKELPHYGTSDGLTNEEKEETKKYSVARLTLEPRKEKIQQTIVAFKFNQGVEAMEGDDDDK